MTEAKEKDSIVIAGISGVGKTTLINSLKSHFEFTYLSYGEYVRKYGLEKAGQKFHEAYNDAPTSLVIMDEHLEYEHDDESAYLADLADIYKRENVRAVIYLEVDIDTLTKRHEEDRVTGKRFRDFIAKSILEEQHLLAKRRALKLQKMCNLAFLFIRNDSLDQSVTLAHDFIEEVLKVQKLREYQRTLHPETIPFDLDQSWNSYWLMKALRKEVSERVDSIVEKTLAENGTLFDPQDLEHQALFYLTTWEPNQITEKIIDEAVEEQHKLVTLRMKNSLTEQQRNFLFRGLSKFYPDLNVRTSDRLTLYRNGKDIFARGQGRNFRVEFKQITDESIIKLYTETLHYIHCLRANGMVFGLFFEGDAYPFAVQSIEYVDRDYKKEALLYAGINPQKTVELTRMYTLPGSPKNIASVMDGQIRRELRKLGVEAMITAVMPAYAKTKGTTVAGGMSIPFLAKKLEHTFYKNQYGLWKHIVSRNEKEILSTEEHKHSKPSWNLPPVIEVVHLFVGRKPFEEKLETGHVVLRESSRPCDPKKVEAPKVAI